MPSPSEVAGLGAPYSIDVLDDEPEVAPPPEAPAPRVPPEALLVRLEPGELAPDAPLERVALYGFRGLHLAVVADEKALTGLRELAPVSDAVPLHPSFAWTYPLVRALDEVAVLLILNQLPDERVNPQAPEQAHALRFGGRSRHEASGYPTWDGHPQHEVAVGSEQWPTEPLLLPVLNLSLGPNSVRFPLSPGDAVQAATFFLSRACVISAAAGNSGAIKGAETLSAWAQVPWVLAVGATDAEDGGALLARSSRGQPEEPETWPDVVAYGASALNPALRGTSFAAPRVAYCATVATAATLYLRHLAQRALRGPVQGIRLLGLSCVDRFGSAQWYLGPPRLPLGVLPELPRLDETGGAREVFARLGAAGWDGQLQLGPEQSRALLLESAHPLEGYAGYQQGKGFISEDGLRHLLATLPAHRWLDLLGLEAHALALPTELRTEPFFTAAQVEQLEAVVRASMQLVMIDYPSGKWKFRPELDEEGGKT